MARSLKNIPVRVFRQYLEWKGLKCIRTKGGHEVWAGKNLARPIIFQSHIDPIPEFIIRNNLNSLGVTKDDFYDFLES
jgi:hypothetical protein